MIRVKTILGNPEVAILADLAADLQVNKQKRKRLGSILGVVIGLLVISGFIDIANGKAGDAIVNIIAILFFLACITFSRKYQVWRLNSYYKKMVADSSLPLEREYTFTEEDIKVMTEGVESTYKWSRISKCELKDHYYLLHTTLESCMIVDLNKISAEDKIELDELLNTKGLL